MLFNLDRNAKQSILNEYKQEALNYRQKKNEERERRIQEERAYLAQREQMDKEANDKLMQEKLQRRNKQMEEYNSMLNMQNNSPHPGFRIPNPKKKDIVINNWGGRDKYQQQQNKTENYIPPIRQMSPNIGQFFQNEDHMGNYLTDEQNNKEVNEYMRSEREYKKNIYRDLLYSQYQEAKKRNLSLYGTDDPLILKRKRKKYLSEDPFAQKSNYGFGESSLARNPILNPQNNIGYNKYLKFQVNNNNRNNHSLRGNSFSQIDNINNTMPLIENPREIYNSNENNLMNNNIGNINRNNNFNTISYQDNNINDLNNTGINNYNYSRREENYNNSNNINNINNNFRRRLNNSNTVDNYNRHGYMNLYSGQSTNYNNNNNFIPTPSGQTIRQAAASNFLYN